MSFGTSVGDAIVILQLAWNTFQGAKQACGEHDELTREVRSLHKVLQRVQREISRSHTPAENDERRKELDEHIAGCEHILRVMNAVLQKYNALGDDKKKGKRLWQKIRFGNGEMRDLADIRLKLSAHTAAIGMSLKLYTLGSLGRVETQLENQGGDLKGLRESINWITANMTAAKGTVGEGSVWTAYENDDKEFWRDLRRLLLQEGFSKPTLQRRQSLIKAYVEELGNRGVFDEDESDDEKVRQANSEEVGLDSKPQRLEDTEESGEENLESSSESEESQLSVDAPPSKGYEQRALPTTSSTLGLRSGSLQSKEAELNICSMTTDNHSETQKTKESGEDGFVIQRVSQTTATQSIQNSSPKGSTPFQVSFEEIVDEEVREGAHQADTKADLSPVQLLENTKLESTQFLAPLTVDEISNTKQPRTWDKGHAWFSKYGTGRKLASSRAEATVLKKHSSQVEESSESSPNKKNESFSIIVKLMTGKRVTIDITPLTTCLQLKFLIQQHEYWSRDTQYLINDATKRWIPEDAVLSQNGICEGSLIHLLFPIWRHRAVNC